MALAYSRIAFERFKRETDRVHNLDAARKAGLPEWPYGYEGNVQNRLDASGVKALALGRTWVGHTKIGEQFIQDIGKNGRFAFHSTNSLITGHALVQGDTICLKSELILFNRERCGHVYRNPEGALENNNAYVYVNPTDLLYFSPAR